MKSTTKVLTLALCFGAMSGIAWGQSIGDFRTHQNGDWNNPNTWEQFVVPGAWFFPASHVPSAADGRIEILNTHEIEITSRVTVDQLVVNGALKVSGTTNTLTIIAGPGTDLSVNGVLNLEGGGDLNIEDKAGCEIRIMEAEGDISNKGIITINQRLTFSKILTNYQSGFINVHGGALIMNEGGDFLNNGILSVSVSLTRGAFVMNGGSINNLETVFIDGEFIYNDGCGIGTKFRYGPYGSFKVRKQPPRCGSPQTKGLQNLADSTSLDIFWPTTDGPADVIVLGNITLTGTRTVSGLLQIVSPSGFINNVGDLLIGGTLELGSGALTGNAVRYGANGSLRLTNPAGYVIENGNLFWPTTNGPKNVTVSSNITLNETRTVSGLLQVVSASGSINNPKGLLLINGTFEPGSGSVVGNPIRYGANGSLRLTNPAGYVIDNGSLFWPRTNGPANVTASANVTLNATRTVSGSLVVSKIFQVAGPDTLITNGTTDISGTLDVVGMYINNGAMQVPGTLQVAGTFTNNKTAQISGTCQINPGSVVKGNAFVYTGCCNKLLFNASYNIASGNVFWPRANGPANVIVPSAFSVILNAVRTISASLDVSGTLQVADTLTVNGPAQITGTLEVTKALITNGTTTITVNGALRVVGTFSNNAATTVNGTLDVAGTFINMGTTQIFKTLQVTGTLTNNGTVQIFVECQVAGTITNNGTMQVDGTFQLDQGGSASGKDFIYASVGTLIFNHFSGSYSVNSGDVIWPETSGPGRVSVQGLGGITMNVARAVQDFETAAGVTNADSLTISGGVVINAGGFFDSPPVYSGEATLFYSTVGSHNVGMEWGGGTAVGSGVPMNVEIGNGTTVNMPSSARTCRGYLSIHGTLALSTTAGADLSVGGDWYNDSGTLIPNSRAVIFNGVTAQTIRGVTTFDDLTVNNPAGISLPGSVKNEDGSITVNSVTVSQELTFTAGNIRFGRGDRPSFLILSGSVSGASTTCHVVTDDNGRLMGSIAGGGSFQFPVGPTETSYNPLTIALDPADPAETFSVSVDSTVSISAPDDSLFVQRTWNIREATGGGNHAALTFQWAGGEEGAKFTRNASSTYLNNDEVVRNGVASGTDPYIVSTTGGFPCTEFSQYIVGRSGGLTAVEKSKNGIPTSFMLSQNHPNPFNPSTTIRYAIPQAGYVTLTMYNLVGKKIETLVSEKQAAGEHEMRWNPVGLPSGIYFYQLRTREASSGSAQTFVATKKLILLQ